MLLQEFVGGEGEEVDEIVGVGEAFEQRDRLRVPGAARLEQATALLERLTHADELVDFLTLPAYELLQEH